MPTLFLTYILFQEAIPFLICQKAVKELLSIYKFQLWRKDSYMRSINNMRMAKLPQKRTLNDRKCTTPDKNKKSSSTNVQLYQQPRDVWFWLKE